MLLEFACSNHKSIRDEVLFSAVAGTVLTISLVKGFDKYRINSMDLRKKALIKYSLWRIVSAMPLASHCRICL